VDDGEMVEAVEADAAQSETAVSRDGGAAESTAGDRSATETCVEQASELPEEQQTTGDDAQSAAVDEGIKRTLTRNDLTSFDSPTLFF